MYMNCNTCTKVVKINNTGICIGCQCGFNISTQEDEFSTQEDEFNNAEYIASMSIDELKEREIYIQNAIENGKESEGYAHELKCGRKRNRTKCC